MPLREYRCPECQKIEEKIVPAGHEPVMICVHWNNAYKMDFIEWSVPAKRNPKYGIG